MCFSSKKKLMVFKPQLFFWKFNFYWNFQWLYIAKLIKLNLFQIVKNKVCIPSVVKGFLMEEANKTQKPKAKSKKIEFLKYI